MSLFADRHEAGRVLASVLEQRAIQDNVVILALPRGGVPVAYEVASKLGAPLDVFLVRKLGVPGHPELAMGAIASGIGPLVDEELVRRLGLSDYEIDAVISEETRELERRERLYREGRPPVTVTGKTAILIDDGLATGFSMRAAIRALRRLSPARVIAAVPVSAPETCAEMSDEADEMVCAATPEPFLAVGLWYRNFSQTTDEDVRALLASADRAHEDRIHSART